MIEVDFLSDSPDFVCRVNKIFLMSGSEISLKFSKTNNGLSQFGSYFSYLYRFSEERSLQILLISLCQMYYEAMDWHIYHQLIWSLNGINV